MYYYKIAGRRAFSEKFLSSGKSEIKEERTETDLISPTDWIAEDQKVALKDIGTELEKKTDNKPVTGETYLPPGGLRGKSIRGK